MFCFLLGALLIKDSSLPPILPQVFLNKTVCT